MKKKYSSLSIFVRAILAVLFLAPMVTNVSFAGIGKSGAEFLMMNAEARPAAMGGTCIAVANGVGSVYRNPAGLAAVGSEEISASHVEWLSDVRFESVGYGRSVEGYGTFGVNALYLYMGDMEGRSANGNRTKDFSAYDMCVSLSYGRDIKENLSLGGSIKFIKQSIEEETASGAAVDIGGLYEIEDSNLILGAAILNVGPKMKFIKDKYSLPMTLGLGVGYRLTNALLAMDMKYQLIDKHTVLNMGAEYSPISFLSLRGGYLFRLLQSGLGDLKYESSNMFSGLGGGAGFKLKGYNIDYAFVPFVSLGNTHKITFTGRF